MYPPQLSVEAFDDPAQRRAAWDALSAEDKDRFFRDRSLHALLGQALARFSDGKPGVQLETKDGPVDVITWFMASPSCANIQVSRPDRPLEEEVLTWLHAQGKAVLVRGDERQLVELPT